MLNLNLPQACIFTTPNWPGIKTALTYSQNVEIDWMTRGHPGKPREVLYSLFIAELNIPYRLLTRLEDVKSL